MTSNKTLLKKAIAYSDIDENHKDAWLTVIDKMSDNGADAVVEFAKQHPEHLTFLIKNLAGKTTARLNQDQDLWQKTIAEEITKVKELFNIVD